MNRMVYVLVAIASASVAIACSSDDDNSSAPAGTGGETQQEQGGAAGDEGTGGSSEAGAAGNGGQAEGGAAGSTGGTSGGSGGSAGSSGPATCESLGPKALSDMTSSDKKIACTCAAKSVGGYDHWESCGGSGEVCIFEQESDCLNKLPKCQVTVSEFLACWEAQGKDLCADIFDLPECQNYLNTCF